MATEMQQVKQDTPLQPWIEQVNAYIEENLGDSSLTVSEVALATFLSERQFYRRIKQITGSTPHQYLKKRRLEKAKECLEAGTYFTVQEVAMEVGYSRSDYFSRLYELCYGIRPIKYLKKSINQD